MCWGFPQFGLAPPAGPPVSPTASFHRRCTAPSSRPFSFGTPPYGAYLRGGRQSQLVCDDAPHLRHEHFLKESRGSRDTSTLEAARRTQPAAPCMEPMRPTNSKRTSPESTDTKSLVQYSHGISHTRKRRPLFCKRCFTYSLISNWDDTCSGRGAFESGPPGEEQIDCHDRRARRYRYFGSVLPC